MNNNYIFDRTAEDIKNLTSKAYLNAADMNRIEGNIYAITAILEDLGYTAGTISKTNWVQSDGSIFCAPFAADMERIRQNIIKLRNIIICADTTPDTPETLNKPDYRAINSVEKILHDIEQLIDNIKASFVYTGDNIYTGGI